MHSPFLYLLTGFFTLLVIPDHDEEHLVEDFEHLCISGHVNIMMRLR